MIPLLKVNHLKCLLKIKDNFDLIFFARLQHYQRQAFLKYPHNSDARLQHY